MNKRLAIVPLIGSLLAPTGGLEATIVQDAQQSAQQPVHKVDPHKQLNELYREAKNGYRTATNFDNFLHWYTRFILYDILQLDGNNDAPRINAMVAKVFLGQVGLASRSREDIEPQLTGRGIPRVEGEYNNADRCYGWDAIGDAAEVTYGVPFDAVVAESDTLKALSTSVRGCQN